jgi:hypothetical protein
MKGKIQIFGHEGNMGKRYRAILEDLGYGWTGFDESEHMDRDYDVDPDAQAVIIATPTDTHAEIIEAIRHCGVPILCEKPVSKDLRELWGLLDACHKAGTKLQMVSQYDELVEPEWKGETSYDYFKTGSDGLAWDCLNVVWHAKGPVKLQSKSPIWRCTINGQPLSLETMDHAYWTMVVKWIAAPRNDLDRIWDAHCKVKYLEDRCLAS